jgi:hypothetical protein
VTNHEVEKNIDLRNGIKSCCDNMIGIFHNSLSKDTYWLLLSNKSKIIGICCFLYRKHYFGIQAMLVLSEHRSKGFGGCFLSLLQDFGIILNDMHDCILPILMMERREYMNNYNLFDFFAKYFIVKPTNKEDLILIEKILKESTKDGITYYMILRLPLSFVIKDFSRNELPRDWSSLIQITKHATLPSDLLLQKNPKYSDVGRISNILFHGDDNYNNWSEKDITKWIPCYFSKQQDKNIIGQIEICKSFLILNNVGSSPFFFNGTKDDKGANNMP